MDNGIADISAFMAIQNHLAVSEPTAIFNVDLADIETVVGEWMEVIGTLRDMGADDEADGEERKLESVLDSTDARIQAAIKAARTAIVELKRSGVPLRDDSTPSAQPDASESLDDTAIEAADLGTAGA